MSFEVAGTIEVKFTDGNFVVPQWWARYPCMRAVTYEDGKPVIMRTLGETREMINSDMLNSVWQSALQKHRRGYK